ncbi:MAG TPA: ABC-F family ATP-binding cassette domain-containing protein [Gordonia sp. (in: high G+C Gram-positive bacteria)]|uniref:ABC-F family ATP-binding cassette domain-containing protein n=1 Tax=Gordonia sp. (in: high G+C Gram-positive bacteria) TaxID=84139 RepID=UPI000F9043F4|nr:ABC-F family ATP-binding cassette domain-containing protein [Gordonia sp. (in: high G+C Gram-positive bacteria)]RUP35375.1 MAG: ABC-F family ATP-binding cassette domain-containing protein [Gordonia sp. (in: high G+C Gram-positive bacteria)]HNP55796.1 ABC-F family ATP-binding cassette domain-containing protein [Gordonia sp. (in: high G+C Gram-positive bacteria)]HRC52464.1 ABC-F family ATP-binding cassette domain-containing protein [Gordonia sp. (in: high G+C Gram-positive bacteria)]
MITATDLEVRAGARTLLAAPDTVLRIGPGDRIGLVGRNGAGKTTSLRILAGETEPYAGTIVRSGEVGYLPQDPKEGDLSVLAKDRVLSARGLDALVRDMEKQQLLMAELVDDGARDKAVRAYGRLEERFAALGGYVAESDAARICHNLGLPDRVLGQQLSTLSGGQRRRVELARILFAASDEGGKSTTTLLLDEPTNHLDADSITWLRSFLQNHDGGLIVISHDVDLLADVVNKVWFLDAVRGEADVYNMGWQKYLDARATDEARRRRERANAEKKAAALRTQAAKLGAKATKATAAQNMLKRAERMINELDAERVADRTAKIRFPEPASCGKTPLMASGLTKTYGSLEIFTGVDLAIDKGSRVVVLGLNGAGKTTLLRLLAGVEKPDAGSLEPGYGLKIGYFAQEHDTLDDDATVWENIRHAAPDAGEQDLRGLLGAFMFSGAQLEQPAGTLSGGEKTRLSLAGLVSSAANVLLLDEPTNNLDPVSREQVLDALRSYTGAVVLVTHDPGAAAALDPQRVILLPDGTEDHWSQDYQELIELA